MSKLRTTNIILFWGALWGIFEGTIGYLLHLLPVNIGYIFWFPIALFFMERAYKATGKLYSVFFIACFAAAIKLINLFVEVRIDRVINPAVSIIIEALAFFAVYYTFNKLPKQNMLVKAITISTSWRFLYLIYLLFVPVWMYNISALSSQDNLFNYLIIENAINSLTIYIYYMAQIFLDRKKAFRVKPAISKTKFALMPLTVLLIAIDIALTLYL